MTSNYSLTLATTCAAVLGLLGCASSPVSDSEALAVPAERIEAFKTPREGATSTIIVTRDGGLQARGCNIGVKIDGIMAAGIGAAEQVRLFVEPGTHVLSITPYGRGLYAHAAVDQAIETTTKPDQARRYRITYDAAFNIRPE